MYFDGETYEPEHDEIRLTGQMLDVWIVMKDGKWRTLQELSIQSGHPEASVSARLRDLRKERFGAFDVERRRKGDPERGLFEYRVTYGLSLRRYLKY